MKAPTIQRIAKSPVLKDVLPARRLERINEVLKMHVSSDLGNSPLARQRRYRQEGNLAIRLLHVKDQFEAGMQKVFPNCFVSVPSLERLVAKKPIIGRSNGLAAGFLKQNLPSNEKLKKARAAINAFYDYYQQVKNQYLLSLKVKR